MPICMHKCSANLIQGIKHDLKEETECVQWNLNFSGVTLSVVHAFGSPQNRGIPFPSFLAPSETCRARNEKYKALLLSFLLLSYPTSSQHMIAHDTYQAGALP